MKLDLHYTEPRLVDLYDLTNSSTADRDFYIQLAQHLNPKVIVDFGCGTGWITRTLAIGARKVIGVDPSSAMLAYARRQPDAEGITWIEGDCSTIGTPNADLAIMTGHVAQVFLDDREWRQTLQALRTALRPGGRLAFESRNPHAQAWKHWNRATTYRRSQTPHGEVEEWLDVRHVQNGCVRFEGHTIFAQTGEHLVGASELRFRSLTELIESLVQSGYAIEQAYGDWELGPVTDSSPELICIAIRT